MKKLLILTSCLAVIILTPSCTAESVDENETTISNDVIQPNTTITPNDHGGNDRDKDKVKT